MRRGLLSMICAGPLAVALLGGAAVESLAQNGPRPSPTAPAADYQTRLQQYQRARQAFEQDWNTYWNAITEKRRVRIAKRRNNQVVDLEDYVLTQPPVYRGPQRPVDPNAPHET